LTWVKFYKALGDNNMNMTEIDIIAERSELQKLTDARTEHIGKEYGSLHASMKHLSSERQANLLASCQERIKSFLEMLESKQPEKLDQAPQQLEEADEQSAYKITQLGWSMVDNWTNAARSQRLLVKSQLDESKARCEARKAVLQSRQEDELDPVEKSIKNAAKDDRSRSTVWDYFGDNSIEAKLMREREQLIDNGKKLRADVDKETESREKSIRAAALETRTLSLEIAGFINDNESTPGAERLTKLQAQQWRVLTQQIALERKFFEEDATWHEEALKLRERPALSAEEALTKIEAQHKRLLEIQCVQEAQILHQQRLGQLSQPSQEIQRPSVHDRLYVAEAERQVGDLSPVTLSIVRILVATYRDDDAVGNIRFPTPENMNKPDLTAHTMFDDVANGKTYLLVFGGQTKNKAAKMDAPSATVAVVDRKYVVDIGATEFRSRVTGSITKSGGVNLTKVDANSQSQRRHSGEGIRR